MRPTAANILGATAATVIAPGGVGNVILDVMSGVEIGTFLRPNIAPLAARKQWLAGQLQVKGKLVLDRGAVTVLKSAGKSLLAVGVKSVSGDFSRGELVSCIDESGVEIARGLINYGKTEAKLIAGLPSTDFERVLGYSDEPELVHRDNLVLI